MTSPRYVKIAMAVAERIYRGEFAIGEKVRGRSTLAGQYGVSPETIRRATSLLSEIIDKIFLNQMSSEEFNCEIIKLVKSISYLYDDKESLQVDIEYL